MCAVLDALQLVPDPLLERRAQRRDGRRRTRGAGRRSTPRAGRARARSPRRRAARPAAARVPPRACRARSAHRPRPSAAARRAGSHRRVRLAHVASPLSRALPQVQDGVGPERPPGLRSALGLARVGLRRRALAARAGRRGRSPGRRRDRRARAWRRTRPSTGRCRAARADRGALARGPHLRPSSTRPSRSAAHSGAQRRSRRAGIASTSSSAGGARRPRSGKTCVSDPSGRGQRLAVALHDARSMRTRGRDRDLLAEHGAHDDLRAVDAAGHAQPRARGDERREQRVARQHGGDRDGIGVQVEQPAAARDGDAEVAHVARGAARSARSRRRATARRSRCRAAGAACGGRRPPAVTSSTPEMARVAKNCDQRLDLESARGREGAGRSSRRRPRSAGRAAAATRAA